MSTNTATATTATDRSTRACRHAGCIRKGKTFKSAAGRTWHLAHIHGVGVEAAPTPEPTPVSEAPKLEGKRLMDDIELRGPAGKRAKRTRTTQPHAGYEAGTACMNVHTGTHAAWVDAGEGTDVVAEAEASVAETPADAPPAWAQTLMLGMASMMERITDLEINSRVSA